jgi:hypothetical protein
MGFTSRFTIIVHIFPETKLKDGLKYLSAFFHIPFISQNALFSPDSVADGTIKP